MNKADCKKQLKKAYKQVIAQNKEITTKSIEEEMKKVMQEQMLEYIAYSKLAVSTLKNSANEVITLKHLLEEIDILPKIYTKIKAIQISENL